MSIWELFKRKLEEPESHCEGCGEPHLTRQLEYIELWDGYFCPRCAIMEGGE